MITAAAVSIAAMWLPLILQVANGGSFAEVVKNYNLSDQLTYLSISQNVASGQNGLAEPHTLTGNSIYPSAYYWLLGFFSRFTGTNVFFAWNVVGMLSTAFLTVAVGAVSTWLSKSRWAWLFGALPFVVGNLQWYVDGTWYLLQGTSHSILWPPYAILFNPGAEVFGLALAVLGFAAVLRSLSQTTRRITYASAGGLAIGLVLDVHTYVGLWAVTVVAVVFFIDRLKLSTRKEGCVALLFALSMLLVAASPLVSLELGKLVVVLIGLLLPVLVIPSWRSLAGSAMAFYGAATFAFLPMLILIARDVTREESFFSFRQQDAARLDLGVALLPTLWQLLPVLAIWLFAAIRTRAASNQHYRIWNTALTAAFISSVLMVFNNYWGLAQEPYRFFPYAFLFLLALSAPALLSPKRSAASAAGVIASVLLLCSTLPSTVAFQQMAFDPPLVVKRVEQNALNDLAKHVGPGLTFIDDNCIDRRLATALSPIRSADYNLGAAVPSNKKAIDVILNGFAAGQLPSKEQFAAANVTSIVSRTSCTQTLPLWRESYGPETYRRPGGVVPSDDYYVFSVEN